MLLQYFYEYENWNSFRNRSKWAHIGGCFRSVREAAVCRTFAKYLGNKLNGALLKWSCEKTQRIVISQNEICQSLLCLVYVLFFFKNIKSTAWKVSKYGVLSAPHFPTFGLNTDRYFVFLCIQSECGKIRTRKNSVIGHFSCSEGLN